MATTELAVCKIALKRIGITRAITATDGIDGASANADTSVEAQSCAAFFDEVRDQVLSEVQWPFATKWALLTVVDASAAAWSAVTTYSAGQMATYDDATYVSLAGANLNHTPGADGSEAWWGPLHDSYAYVYTYPTDCVAPRYLYTGSRTPLEDERYEYSVEANRVLSAKVIATDYEDAILVYTARVETVSLWPPLFVSAVAWALAAELVMPCSKKAELAVECMKRARIEIGLAAAQAQNAQQGPADPDCPAVAARGG